MFRTDSLLQFLEDALASGRARIGEIEVSRSGAGFSLRHREDAGCEGLEVFSSPRDAAKIALFSDSGEYRPLKSAPNLRHGWRLDLGTLGDLRLALDAFYPAALGNWRAHLRGDLMPVVLRDTLSRQTGMYRVTAKLTDSQGRQLVERFCRKGCLREILWRVAPSDPPHACREPAQPEFPLLCGEACNLFVAEARKTVKGSG